MKAFRFLEDGEVDEVEDEVTIKKLAELLEGDLSEAMSEEDHEKILNDPSGYVELCHYDLRWGMWWNEKGCVDDSPLLEEMVDSVPCCEQHGKVRSLSDVRDLHGEEHLKSVRERIIQELLPEIEKWKAFSYWEGHVH